MGRDTDNICIGGYMSDNLIEKMIRYEQDNLDRDEIVQLFQELLDTGMIFKLQGHYQRTANRLMQVGLITMPQGEVK